MLKKTAGKHFRTQRALAQALVLSDAAISQWKDVIPEKDVYRLEVVTNGALKYRDDLYRRSDAVAVYHAR